MPEPADPFSATGELVALSGGLAGPDGACFTCHGLDGGGDGAGAPRLAGLEAGYLLKQLQDYGDGRRPDPVMGPIAQRLDDRARREVADWYAALPAPASAGPDATPAAAGRELYHRGDPGRGLAACADCHGADAAGGGLANPALAGQPAAYAAEQLRRFAVGERRNDPRGVMWDASRRLAEEERAAVAAYLASIPASDSSGGSTPGAMPARTSSRSQK